MSRTAIRSLLKRKVETGREAIAERLKLGEGERIRWCTGVMKRHVPVYCIVPPNTVADIQKYILDEHQSQPDISISPSA